MGSRFTPGAFFVVGLGCAQATYKQLSRNAREKSEIIEEYGHHIETNRFRVLPIDVVRGRQNPLHSGFARRLAHARKAAKTTSAALSLSVGMSADASWRLEAGGRIPRLDTVEKLASALNVSPCLLAYGVEMPCQPHVASLSMGLPGRLVRLRQERGFSRRQLGRMSGTSDNFVQMTETGTTVPNIAKVEQLAKALQVSVCWLAFGLGTPELPERRRPRSDTPPAPAPSA
jgi:transcriptional regulator with XRE-family HTH domain